MMTLPTFLRSLLLTGALSFAAPIVLIGTVLISFYVVGQVPFIDAFSQAGVTQILNFLAVFGNGDAVEGMLIIGLTCSLVGALFDTYAFYRHQNLRGG
ncbi:hypothetical protein [Leptothermofonsia sp. ETS-13]|uniref:hypothetical protein n=1 Tax=Leptothermofonsia sp. ETS-13 TaxID=3035696 RepID=UPI003BA1B15E